MIISKLFKTNLSSNNNLINILIRRSLAAAQQGAGHGAGAGHGGHAANPKLWMKLFFFVCIPAIVVSAVNTYLAESEHQKHYERPEFKPFEFRYIRKKQFPWGDGNHSLFHNPKYNALPDGWEPLPELDEKSHH